MKQDKDEILPKSKIMAMIHCKESVSAMVDDYNHISLYDHSKPAGAQEIARFYVKDLLFMNELINHFVKPSQDRANQLSDALYPRELSM